MVFKATKIFTFEMAHKLETAYSKECLKLHGHSYRLEVCIKSNVLNDDGMIMDFKYLKKVVQPIVDEFDHQCLIKGENFPINPTAENMIEYIFKKIEGKLLLIQNGSPELHKLRLWETATAYVEVAR